LRFVSNRSHTQYKCYLDDDSRYEDVLIVMEWVSECLESNGQEGSGYDGVSEVMEETL
jgi:hypothetical protein